MYGCMDDNGADLLVHVIYTDRHTRAHDESIIGRLSAYMHRSTCIRGHMMKASSAPHLKRGSQGPISKMGLTWSLVGPIGVRYSAIPLRMMEVLSTRKPDISIAPQKDTSPSPCGRDSNVGLGGKGMPPVWTGVDGTGWRVWGVGSRGWGWWFLKRVWDLREVHVAHGQVRALHKHREVDLRVGACIGICMHIRVRVHTVEERDSDRQTDKQTEKERERERERERKKERKKERVREMGKTDRSRPCSRVTGS